MYRINPDGGVRSVAVAKIVPEDEEAADGEAEIPIVVPRLDADRRAAPTRNFEAVLFEGDIEVSPDIPQPVIIADAASDHPDIAGRYALGGISLIILIAGVIGLSVRLTQH